MKHSNEASTQSNGEDDEENENKTTSKMSK